MHIHVQPGTLVLLTTRSPRSGAPRAQITPLYSLTPSSHPLPIRLSRPPGAAMADTTQRDAAQGTAEGQPPVKPISDSSAPLKLGSLRLSLPDQNDQALGTPDFKSGAQDQKASAFTSSTAQHAVASDVALSPARPPPSPMMRLLSRKGSFTERPIDVMRMACIMQRNELCSLFAR